MRMWTRLMTLLFGPPCAAGCGKHVYPKDVFEHRKKWCTAQRKEEVMP